MGKPRSACNSCTTIDKSMCKQVVFEISRASEYKGYPCNIEEGNWPTYSEQKSRLHSPPLLFFLAKLPDIEMYRAASHLYKQLFTLHTYKQLLIHSFYLKKLQSVIF